MNELVFFAGLAAGLGLGVVVYARLRRFPGTMEVNVDRLP